MSYLFVLFLLLADEVLNGVNVNQLLVFLLDPARRVVGVFNLHADVGSLVECHCSRGLLALRDSHVELEGLVGLVLTILDAGGLCRRFSAEVLRVDAVEVAAAEEELGQGGLHDCVALVFGVTCPGASGLSHYYALLLIIINKILEKTSR